MPRAAQAATNEHQPHRGTEDTWTFTAGSTGPRTTTTSPWPTGTGTCWPAAASATTRPGSRNCWACSPNTATPRTTRSRWPSRPRAGYWSPACAPPAARSTPSTRWRSPVTGTGTPSPAASPIPATPQFWPTCCAPTSASTGRCPPTPNWPRPSPCSPAPSKTPFWDRITAHNKLRSHLREYFPGFLHAFASARGGILRPEARTILAAAPTPADAARLTAAQLRALLKKACRRRGIDAEATRLRDTFRAGQMRQLPLVEQAMGRQAIALLRQLDAACASADELERAVTDSFNQHPDAGIITSFPGLGTLTGARVLAEIGDDRSRFQDAKGLKAYAGAAPITRASGKTKSITRRHIKNNRLNAAGYTWAFSALTASPGARAHYDRRRDDGDRHAAAQRNLFGRLLGCLHRCLATGQHYDENIAFPGTAHKLRQTA